MLPATRLEVTAHSEYDRRYDGPDGTLRHCVLDTPASKQVRRRNDGERDDKRNEKPTNPKQCSHAKNILSRPTLESSHQRNGSGPISFGGHPWAPRRLAAGHS